MTGSRLKLVTGGRVLDLGGDLDHPEIADVLIEGDRIVAVGAAATARAGALEGVETIHAEGHLLIPGLVNSHYHSHDVLLRGSYEQMPLDIWGLYTHPANYRRISTQDIGLRTLLGAADALCNGITTMQDMVTIADPERGHVDAIMGAYEASGARAAIGLQIADAAGVDAVPFWRDLPDDVTQLLPGAADTSALQRLIETLVMEGGRDKIDWVLAPSAPQRCSDGLLRWVAELSAIYGLQVFTHLYEARSQVVLARQAYEGGSLLAHLEKFGLVGPRLTIAHGIWIDEEEIRRFGAAGANLAFNPMSNMKLRNGFAPIVAYDEAGAGLALGCDNCSCNDTQNLFLSMKMFALFWGFQTQAGESGAARRAFAAATLGGAKALGRAGDLGAIRPGYLADMVMIDLSGANYRPLNSAIRQLVYGESGQNIRAVMVGGEIVVRDGELLAYSNDELKQAAEDARSRMREEVEQVEARNAGMLKSLLEAYEKAEAVELPFDRFSIRR
ncbi:MAG: amidohydrolase [Hyphomicrobiales bacterium]|nr:amidohydrolase [Hyphomicrobiales bacterium]